ncbi:CRISPR-associated endonuclease Cas6 [Acanthopleuribacter pedis]|uniref:DNA repair protein n=1 Tax=Acanthopleuribacter pedis TaxID=442870 RepID=A0A8J7U3M9_9BACT|nr:CRISPR-associated endonuclease Cas6 [Acanthopleuribacter pedis]MBO1318508.1 hypothetical protein [Acanthopleuribacter pedis]
MPQLDLTLMTFQLEGAGPRDSEFVRGYLGNRFRECTLLHNHLENGELRFRYPLVQYRVADERVHLLGINEGGAALRHIFLDMTELILRDRRVPLFEKQIIQKTATFGYHPEPINYRFTSPWLGLNQKNFPLWRKADPTAKADLLRRALVGNLLALCKGLDLRLHPDQRLTAAPRLTPTEVGFKQKQMIGFRGGFRVNFIIPEGLGLGKSVARGFGAVARDTEVSG